jgi:hypothetical protein
MTERVLSIGQNRESGGICCAYGLPCQTIGPFRPALSKDMEKLRLVTVAAWLLAKPFFMHQLMFREEESLHGCAK